MVAYLSVEKVPIAGVDDGTCHENQRSRGQNERWKDLEPDHVYLEKG